MSVIIYALLGFVQESQILQICYNVEHFSEILLFSDPHFQWGRKINICYFPTHIFNGEGKSSYVAFFVQILPKLHFVQLHSTYSVSLLSLHPSY